MATSVYTTFSDIYTAVITDAKENTASSNVVENVQRWVNEGYEVVNFRKKRAYLDKRFVISLQGKVESSFTMTEGSSIAVHTGTATLLSSSYDLGFKVSGFEENYEVSSISGTTVVLTTTYKGIDASAATAVIYQRSVVLDPSISEVYQVWHDYYRQPLTALGSQKMRENQLFYPEQYDYATSWAVFGQDNTVEARRLVLWPYPNVDYTIYLDTNVFVDELVLPTDEPIIPLQYRQILYWYALAQLFGKFHRNTEREQAALQNFNVWLAKLDGINEVSQDLPRMIVDYRRPRTTPIGNAFDRRYREDPPT